MADIFSKFSECYFHGVRGATLARLVHQSENGQIALWGTDQDEHVTEDFEKAEYVQGAGYLYVTDISDMEMSFNEFCDEGGMVLVLEPQVEYPFDFEHPSDYRQHIIKVEEWKVIAGLRPVYDEEDEYQEEIIDHEIFSLEDLLAEHF